MRYKGECRWEFQCFILPSGRTNQADFEPDCYAMSFHNFTREYPKRQILCSRRLHTVSFSVNKTSCKDSSVVRCLLVDPMVSDSSPPLA